VEKQSSPGSLPMVAAAGLIRDQEGKGGAAAFLYGGKEGSRIWKEGRRLGGFRKEWRIGLRDFLPPPPYCRLISARGRPCQEVGLSCWERKNGLQQRREIEGTAKDKGERG
jgi:hypothetical protein